MGDTGGTFVAGSTRFVGGSLRRQRNAAMGFKFKVGYKGRVSIAEADAASLCA